MLVDTKKWAFGFTIGCNDFLPMFDTVEQEVKKLWRDNDLTDNEVQRILEVTGELWSFRGYPRNSVGFYTVFAPTSGALFDKIREVEVELDATS